MALTAAEPQASLKPRRVTILGSTGSVGCNTVDLIERHPGAFVVEAMSARSNVALLAEQARRLRPRLAVIADEGGAPDRAATWAGDSMNAAVASPTADIAATPMASPPRKKRLARGGSAAGRPAGRPSAA